MKTKTLNLVAISLLSSGVVHAATVSKIEVSGKQRMDDESVRILANVKIGENIGEMRANEIAKDLEKSGYFSKINVRMNGNTLKINVIEAPIINQVTV